MRRLGVILDGISRDPEYALGVAREAGLDEVELQFVWEREVGDLDAGETRRLLSLLNAAGLPVSCISRHVFSNLLARETEPGGAEHRHHLDKLADCIGLAHATGCELVRIMSCRREMILFGEDGAEHWNVAHGAWEGLKNLVRPAVEMAERENVTLVVETGNGGTICSARLGQRLVDEIGSERLKVLWDPANCLFSGEVAAPDGLAALGDGSGLGHFHVKDVVADPAGGHLRVCEMGDGHLASSLEPMAAWLKEVGYTGATSLEAVYRPAGGTFEDGFHACVGKFREIFG